jgi:hypothetical protein
MLFVRKQTNVFSLETLLSIIIISNIICCNFNFRSGDLDQLTGLKLIDYLEKEDRYLPFWTMTTVAPHFEGMIFNYPDFSNFRVIAK